MRLGREARFHTPDGTGCCIKHATTLGLALDGYSQSIQWWKWWGGLGRCLNNASGGRYLRCGVGAGVVTLGGLSQMMGGGEGASNRVGGAAVHLDTARERVLQARPSER